MGIYTEYLKNIISKQSKTYPYFQITNKHLSVNSPKTPLQAQQYVQENRWVKYVHLQMLLSTLNFPTFATDDIRTCNFKLLYIEMHLDLPTGSLPEYGGIKV